LDSEVPQVSQPRTTFKLLLIMLAVATMPAIVRSQSHEIAVGKSSLTVWVFKSGLFSAFAHDHEIEDPIVDGKIDSSATPVVELRLDARKMKVVDPGVSTDDRAEIQRTMEGASVLDTAHFPGISFESRSVTKMGDASWMVHGELTLHGQKRPVDVTVSLQGDHYRGTASFKQSGFWNSSHQDCRRHGEGERRSQNRFRHRSRSIRVYGTPHQGLQHAGRSSSPSSREKIGFLGN